MTDQERHALLTLTLMAAFADGDSGSAEQAEVKRLAASMSQDGSVDAVAISEAVAAGRVTLDETVAQLTTPETRRLAWEYCTGACHADGALNDAERAFLSSLQERLGFDAQTSASATAFTARAEAVALAPLAAPTSEEPPLHEGSMTAEEQDRVILHYAVLNGALEILPESLGTLAIIPLQMKLVYRIGKSYGYELDRGHIKDLLATAGIGMASQYVERIGTGLLRQVFGHGLLGGLIGGVARQAVSSGLAFATTYALGRLAVRYYAGGRQFSSQVLKDTYEQLLNEARGLHGRYEQTIREKARTINVSEILQDVRA